MPDAERPEWADLSLWSILDRGLDCLRSAEFELGRGDDAAALMWMHDVRRALGEAALALSERSETIQAGYRALARELLRVPKAGPR